MPFFRHLAARQVADSWLSERKDFLQRSWRKLLVISAVMVGITAFFQSHIRIGWDPQKNSCLPWHFFIYSPIDDVEVPRRGQLVRVNLPKHAPAAFPRQLREALETGLPGGGAKIVVGMPGDRIRIRNNWLVVNNEPWGFLWLMNTLRLKDKQLDTDYRVPAGHYLVLGTQPESYDGRYWGVIPQKDILGSIRVLF